MRRQRTAHPCTAAQVDPDEVGTVPQAGGDRGEHLLSSMQEPRAESVICRRQRAHRIFAGRDFECGGTAPRMEATYSTVREHRGMP